jgi:hypothetical protein
MAAGVAAATTAGVEPELYCRVRLRGWTPHGSLHNGIFCGWIEEEQSATGSCRAGWPGTWPAEIKTISSPAGLEADRPDEVTDCAEAEPAARQAQVPVR